MTSLDIVLALELTLIRYGISFLLLDTGNVNSNDAGLPSRTRSRLTRSLPRVVGDNGPLDHLKMDAPKLPEDGAFDAEFESLETDYLDYIYPDDNGTTMPKTANLVLGRAHPVRANIEVLIVADFCDYQRRLLGNNYNRNETLSQMVNYYRTFINMVSGRYEALESQMFSLKVTLAGIAIPETSSEGIWLERQVVTARGHGYVRATTALAKLQRWLRIEASSLPRYDHAMTVTPHRLLKGKRTVDGLAYLGAICRTSEGKSASIIHDKGDYLGVIVAVHELTHSLGVHHDGAPPNEACPAEANNVMAPHHGIHGMESNLFSFSSCSHGQIFNALVSSAGSCLYDKGPKWRKALADDLIGQSQGIDEQCRQMFGDRYVACEDRMRLQPCGQVWCRVRHSNLACRTKSRLLALPGTACLSNGVCKLGQCVLPNSTIKPLPVNTKCETGTVKEEYCRRTLGEFGPRACAHKKIQVYCCNMCMQ